MPKALAGMVTPMTVLAQCPQRKTSLAVSFAAINPAGTLETVAYLGKEGDAFARNLSGTFPDCPSADREAFR